MISLLCDECGKHISDSSPGMQPDGPQFAYSYVMGYSTDAPQYEFCSHECMKEHMRSNVFREVPVEAGY